MTALALDQWGPRNDAYSRAVNGISGLVAHWALGETGGPVLYDECGRFPGIYMGTPTFQAVDLTWDESDDRSVDFGGDSYGEVPHDSAFLLAEGALSFIFEASATAVANDDGILSKGTGFQLRLEKFKAGQVGTDLVLDFGTAELRSWVSVPHLTNPIGMIDAGRPHHVVVMWNTERVILCVDGFRVAWDEAHTAGLTANTSAWQFGRVGGADGDVQLDEAVLYDRMLDDQEIDDLFEAQRRLVPYDPNGALDEINVANDAGLSGELATAAPGDHLLLAGGQNYGTRTISDLHGTRDDPIVIRPADTGNRPDITGDWELNNCSWLIVDGMDMNAAARATMDGGCDHCRFTRLVWTNQTDAYCFRIVEAKNWRIDHSELAGRPNDTSFHRFIDLEDDPAYDGTLRRGLIDHLYIHDIAPTAGANGQEILTAGATKSVAGFIECVIELCLVQDVNLVTEAETLSMKESGGILRYCTFDNIDTSANPSGNNDNYVQIRRALSWEIRSCWVEDGRDNSSLITQSRDQFVIGNRIAGNGAISIQQGDITAQEHLDAPASNGGTYAAAEHCLIVGNIAPGSQIRIGFNHAGASGEICSDIWCEANTTITENGASAGNPDISGTTSEPYTAAVKLTSADVGRAGAAHPRTPAGYV